MKEWMKKEWVSERTIHSFFQSEWVTKYGKWKCQIVCWCLSDFFPFLWFVWLKTIAFSFDVCCTETQWIGSNDGEREKERKKERKDQREEGVRSDSSRMRDQVYDDLEVLELPFFLPPPFLFFLDRKILSLIFFPFFFHILIFFLFQVHLTQHFLPSH